MSFFLFFPSRNPFLNKTKHQYLTVTSVISEKSHASSACCDSDKTPPERSVIEFEILNPAVDLLEALSWICGRYLTNVVATFT